MSVSANFNAFCNHLKFTSQKESIISNRFRNICKQLNKKYWKMDASYGGMYIGSKGRQTVVDNGQNIDMIFEMPTSMLNSYYGENAQQSFLEDVNQTLLELYWNTQIDKDKHTIRVIFSDKMVFHILPVFRNMDGSYTKADLNEGGTWKNIDPISEIRAMDLGDHRINVNLRRLCQMARTWKMKCNVPLHNRLLDTFARDFLMQWEHKNASYAKYDIMCRDFFKYLMDQDAQQTEWNVLGDHQILTNSNQFRYNAIIAHDKATEAIQLEEEDKHWTARQKWREIFGIKFPEDIVEELKLNKIGQKAISIYEAQQKCAQTLHIRSTKTKVLQFALAMVIVFGILILGYTTYFNIGIMIFGIASFLFIINVFMQKSNIAEVIKKHQNSAQNALEIKEECRLILHDLNYNALEMAVIQERIEKVWNKINATTYMGDHSVVNYRYIAIQNTLRDILHITDKGTKLPLHALLSMEQKYKEVLPAPAA